MSKKDHKNIVVDKSQEMRSKEISRMIGEGGLGADKYYSVKKSSPDNLEEEKMVDEGGLGTSKNYDKKESIDNFSVSPSDEEKEE